MMRLVRSLRGDQRGLGLAEVMVATLLFLIVGSLALAGFVSVLRSQTQVRQRTLSQAKNRQGIELMTRLLRQATYAKWGDYSNSTIVTTAEPRKVIFTAHFGDAERKKYVFEISGTELRWGSSDPVCPATSPAPGSGAPACTYITPTLSRTAVTGVRNAVGGGVCPGAPADGAIFSYFESDAVNGTLVPVPQPVTGDRLTRISSIDIRMFVKQENQPIPGCEELHAHVELRNLPF